MIFRPAILAQVTKVILRSSISRHVLRTMPGKRSKGAAFERGLKKTNNDNAKSRRVTDTAIALCESLYGAEVLTREQRNDIVANLARTASQPEIIEPKVEPPTTESQGAEPK